MLHCYRRNLTGGTKGCQLASAGQREQGAFAALQEIACIENWVQIFLEAFSWEKRREEQLQEVEDEDG